MNDIIWKRVLKFLGLAFIGALLWKTAKYFFLVFVLVGIIIIVKIVCGTYVNVVDISNKREVECVRAKAEVESNAQRMVLKDIEEQKVKLQEIALQQKQEENIRKTAEDTKRRRAYDEIKRQTDDFNERFYYNYRALEMQRKAMFEWQAKGVGEHTYIHILSLEERMNRARPSEYEAEKNRDRIKATILAIYGLNE